MALPVSFTVDGWAALVTIESVAVKVPLAVGTKVRSTRQEAPGASVLPAVQVDVGRMLKTAGFVPPVSAT